MNEEKVKKPFYKRAWFIILVIIIALIVCSNISDNIKESKKGSEIKLSTTQLGSALPELPKLKGEINSDSEKHLSIDLYKASSSDFESYMEKCKEKGFNNDSNRSSSMYSAKNEDGTSLSLFYTESSKKLSIIVNTYNQEDLTNTNSIDNNTFTISNTTNTDTSSVTQETTTPAPTQTPAPSTTQGISKEFKEFMDSYEAYMNEYVEFMKKYQKNSTDLTLIAQYAETVKKYTEWADKFDKYDEEHDLTKEELAYYLDVQTRVNKKLLEVSN